MSSTDSKVRGLPVDNTVRNQLFSCPLALSQSESLCVHVRVRVCATGDKTMREACEEWGIDDMLN